MEILQVFHAKDDIISKMYVFYMRGLRTQVIRFDATANSDFHQKVNPGVLYKIDIEESIT